MNFAAAKEMAANGRLYPSVILHGRDADARRNAAIEFSRLLLCATPGDDPAGSCSHCRRIAWPGAGQLFHPDLHVLEQDLRTATSVEATKRLLRGAKVAPFEARGQVFIVAAAESLSGEAANALLKTLEEPHLTAPRNFFLLAPSQFDLLPTLRSRSLTIFLGASAGPDVEQVAPVAAAFGAAIAAYADSRSPVDLLSAAAALESGGDWKDVRAAGSWSLAAAAVRHAVDDAPAGDRRALLAFAEALLDGQRLRLRGVPARRILEGLVTEHLGGG